jgi:hypothetical protein
MLLALYQDSAMQIIPVIRVYYTYLTFTCHPGPTFTYLHPIWASSRFVHKHFHIIKSVVRRLVAFSIIRPNYRTRDLIALVVFNMTPNSKIRSSSPSSCPSLGRTWCTCKGSRSILHLHSRDLAAFIPGFPD